MKIVSESPFSGKTFFIQLPPGFHDEEAVKEMRYSRLGHTDMLVSNFGLGGTPFGAEICAGHIGYTQYGYKWDAAKWPLDISLNFSANFSRSVP